MGEGVGKTVRTNGSVRNNLKTVVPLQWAHDVHRNFIELMIFRVAMIRLESANPDAFAAMQNAIRGVDMDALGMYHGNSKLNDKHNG